MTLKFSNGIKIETDGPYAMLELTDGFYIAGHNVCIPCGSHAEATATWQRLTMELLRGDEVNMVIFAINRKQMDGVPVADAGNLCYFNPTIAAKCVEEIRPVIREEHYPLLDAVLAKLEEYTPLKIVK
jgi:hypothetical protein